jgi:diacylglycerol kinase family enzyme
MKHIFIMNPVAGNGISTGSYSEKIKKAFEELNISDEYEIHITTSETDAYDYTKSQVETGEHIRFYACGGNGTLSEVVNACAEKKNAEVAAIPLGSGNDFIRIFGKKEDLLDELDCEDSLSECDDEFYEYEDHLEELNYTYIMEHRSFFE